MKTAMTTATKKAVFCDFQPFDAIPGACRCSRCGYVDSSVAFAGQCGRFRRPCDVQPPGMVQKVGRYTKAIRQWTRAGRPRRTEGEIVDIYSNLCVPCIHFDKKSESCTICGCYVRQSKRALLNKIAMATEACSAIPPRWTAAVAVADKSGQ